MEVLFQLVCGGDLILMVSDQRALLFVATRGVWRGVESVTRLADRDGLCFFAVVELTRQEIVERQMRLGLASHPISNFCEAHSRYCCR